MKAWVLFFILLLLSGGVLSIEGVSPGSYEVDFEAGLDKEFVFDFVVDGVEGLSVDGIFSDYVSLDKERVSGEEKVVANLRLPPVFSESEKASIIPGVNDVRIIAGDVSGVIKIKVPYPDRYVDLGLFVPNVNAGDSVPINLKLSNLGRKVLNVSPVVDIYFNDNLVESFSGDKRVLGVSSVEDYIFSFDSSNSSVGDYFAVASVGEFSSKDSFRLGKVGLRILNYSHEVRAGGIREVEIEVENLGKERLENVYVEVRNLDSNSSFDSSIFSLNGWQRRKVISYVDSSGLRDRAMFDVSVYYGDEVESKSVDIFVYRRFGLWIWVGGVFFVILLLFFYWKFFRKSK